MSFIKNLYFGVTDWGNQKANMGMYTDYLVDQQIDNNNPLQTTSTVPKLEDFFGGDHLHTTSYNSQTETTTQDSSSQLTHLYESNTHQNSVPNYFTSHNTDQYQDLKAMTLTNNGFQADLSANSGSEVDDSTATQLGGGANGAEFVGHSIDSTQTELVPSYATVNDSNNGGSLSLSVVPQSVEKSVVAAGGDSEKCVKKISDTFGQRTSIYRGVTR